MAFRDYIKVIPTNTDILVGASRFNGAFGVLAQKEQFPINNPSAKIFDTQKETFPIHGRDFDPDPMNPLKRRQVPL